MLLGGGVDRFGPAGRGCGRAEGFFPQAKRGGLEARALISTQSVPRRLINNYKCRLLIKFINYQLKGKS
jgi:hypothetical protein